MSETAEVIRPILFVIRLFLWISAVIVMGLTAWAVTHLKGYRTVYTLVIVCIIVVLFLANPFRCVVDTDISYAGGSRNGILHPSFLHFAHASQPWIHASTRHYLLRAVRWIHYHPCGPFIHLEEPEADIELEHRWLAAFIFVAQTDNLLNGDHIGCHFYVWNLTSGCTRRNAIEAFTFLSL